MSHYELHRGKGTMLFVLLLEPPPGIVAVVNGRGPYRLSICEAQQSMPDIRLLWDFGEVGGVIDRCFWVWGG